MKNVIWLSIILFISLSSCAQKKGVEGNAATVKNQADDAQKRLTQLPPVLEEGNYNKLTKSEYYIIEEKGTERSFSGEYNKCKIAGVYICRRCNFPLFSSDDKFDSGTGWPSFDDEVSKGAVKEETDSDGSRTEILCSHCDGHLGHVFKNEGMTSKNTRHCVNSASIQLVEGIKP